MNPPDLVLGTAMWGWTMDKPTCFKVLDYFYAKGYRKVDGATNYPINKIPADFRLSERILEEWIQANQVNDLEITMKIGSINNMRSPEHNLASSFLLLNLDDYQFIFGSNLQTLMIHWDNRSDESEVEKTFNTFKTIESRGLKLGLSGIKHPEIYARLNQSYGFDFTIQCKHNLLKSDYPRYQAFHGKKRFMVYGINAGGLKLNSNAYHASSSLKVRGGNIEEPPKVIAALKALLDHLALGNQVTSFNECAMVFAHYSPDIHSILIGPSKVEQLKQTIHIQQRLLQQDYEKLYLGMQKLAAKT